MTGRASRATRSSAVSSGSSTSTRRPVRPLGPAVQQVEEPPHDRVMAALVRLGAQPAAEPAHDPQAQQHEQRHGLRDEPDRARSPPAAGCASGPPRPRGQPEHQRQHAPAESGESTTKATAKTTTSGASTRRRISLGGSMALPSSMPVSSWPARRDSSRTQCTHARYSARPWPGPGTGTATVPAAAGRRRSAAHAPEHPPAATTSPRGTGACGRSRTRPAPPPTGGSARQRAFDPAYLQDVDGLAPSATARPTGIESTRPPSK